MTPENRISKYDLAEWLDVAQRETRPEPKPDKIDPELREFLETVRSRAHREIAELQIHCATKIDAFTAHQESLYRQYIDEGWPENWSRINAEAKFRGGIEAVCYEKKHGINAILTMLAADEAQLIREWEFHRQMRDEQGNRGES